MLRRPREVDCRVCGSGFQVGPRGRIPYYCSEDCRAYGPTRCVDCGTPVHRGSTRCEQHYHAGTRTIGITRCGWCQRAFRPRQQGIRYCSRQCVVLLKNAIAIEVKALRRLGRRVVLGCHECGSRERRGRCRECSRVRGRRYWVRHSPNRDNPRRCCVGCGKEFIAKPGSWRRSTCSPYCSKYAAKRLRLARLRAAPRGTPYTYLGVAERDHWRCQLCGGPVNREKRVPHPKAGTIDHTWPLALGGTEGGENVQLAHFRCNSIKGCRGTGMQLALGA